MSIGEPSHAHRKTRVGSERSFGIVFAAFFAVVGLLPLLSRDAPRAWALGVAIGFLVVAIVFPKALRPLNWLWFRFGLLLHAIVSPITMSLIFWISVVPVGIVARLFGKDFLRLKRDPDAASYWITRDPPGLGKGSMDRQF